MSKIKVGEKTSTVKKSDNILEEYEELSQLKWECVRRNSEYQDDYARWKKLKREEMKLGVKGDDTEANKLYLQLCDKYRLLSIKNPVLKCPVPAFRGLFPVPVTRLKHQDENVLLLKIDLSHDKKYLMYFVEKLIDENKIRGAHIKNKKGNQYEFNVDMTEPRDSRLIAKLCSYINNPAGSGDFDIGCLLRGGVAVKKQPRKYLENIHIYLQTWDLRTGGKSFEEIARIVFSKEWEDMKKIEADDPNDKASNIKKALIQKANDNYKRAKKLIEGGYQDLK